LASSGRLRRISAEETSFCRYPKAVIADEHA
jgi:hypothetical protein